MDARVCAFLNKYPDMIEYMLVSDQYVGYKVQVTEEQAAADGASSTSASNSPSNGMPLSTTMGLPKSRCMLVVCFNVPGKGLNTSAEDMERMQPALQLTMHLIDRVGRVRLSKEAKVRALKRRKDVAEQFMKLTHRQRQEVN